MEINMSQFEGNEIVVDLTDRALQGYVNLGSGITDQGVTYSDDGIVFKNICNESNVFPMFALDFSAYLEKKGIHIADVKSFEIVAAVYDKSGKEIDLSEEYQKCAFVSPYALNGYSQSDILPCGNYKLLGSGIVTKFDLTKYTGYTSDGITLSSHDLDEGVGFNIQLLNGEFTKLDFLVLFSLKFLL